MIASRRLPKHSICGPRGPQAALAVPCEFGGLGLWDHKVPCGQGHCDSPQPVWHCEHWARGPEGPVPTSFLDTALPEAALGGADHLSPRGGNENMNAVGSRLGRAQRTPSMDPFTLTVRLRGVLDSGRTFPAEAWRQGVCGL